MVREGQGEYYLQCSLLYGSTDNGHLYTDKCANNLRCLFMNRGACFMVSRIMVPPTPYWFNCLPVPSCNTYFVRIMVNPLDTTAEPLFLCIYMVSTDKKKRHITMGKKVAPNFVRHWQKPPVKNGLAFQTNQRPEV